MNYTPALRHATRLLAAVALISSAVAQTVAPTKPARASDEEETIKLSPFTVSTEKDNGYLATDVISGGMLATNLLKTATDVTVLTRDFLDDVGAFDMQRAQIWLNSSDPGSDTVNSTNPTDFGQATAFRGLQGSNNTRNYFRQDFTPQNYVVERVEGSRGPNGIIYGDATQGGKVNFITKRAKFHDFGSVKLRIDNFGEPFGRGVYADFNRRLRDNWAVRLNVQDKKGGQWYDKSVDDVTGFAFTTSFRPWRGGELRFDTEKERITRTNFRPDLSDNQSGWDRTTVVTGPLASAPASSTGIGRLGNDTWVYTSGVGVFNWRNFGQTNGTGLMMYTDLEEGRDAIPNFPTIPKREFNPNSSNEKLDQHQINHNLTFEQNFQNGFSIEAAGDFAAAIRTGDTLYMGNSYIDVNQVLPNGQPNPNFKKVYSSTNGWNPVRTGSYASAARLAAAYRLPFKSFSQTISAVASYRERLDAFKAWQYFRDNGALAPSGLTGSGVDNNQRVNIWRYWDDPDAPTIMPTDDATNKYRWVMSRDQHNRSQLKSVQVNTVGSYFHDTLTIVGGIRTDRFHATTRDIQRRDPATGTPTAAGGIWVDTNATTPQLGLTYFPIKQLGIALYQSDGFNPSVINTRKLDDSAPYDLAVSHSKGAGLRFNLLDNRIVGGITYYDSYEKDRYTQQGLGQINNIWDRMTDAGYTDGPNKRIAQLGGLAQYTDATTIRAWGWEGELTANLTKALRVTINGSIPHTKQTNSLPDTKAYYASNIALWNQWRSYTRVNDAVNTLENIISGFVDGRPINGLFRYRANVFGNYTFQSGALRNLRLGAGANFLSEQIIGNVTGRPFEFIYADAYYLVTLTAGYSTKIGRFPVDFHVAISNLLNYDEPIYRNGGVATITRNGQTMQYRSQYYWPIPRSIQLTTTVKF